jgi:hypothetical protein
MMIMTMLWKIRGWWIEVRFLAERVKPRMALLSMIKTMQCNNVTLSQLGTTENVDDDAEDDQEAVEQGLIDIAMDDDDAINDHEVVGKVSSLENTHYRRCPGSAKGSGRFSEYCIV